MIEPTPQSLGRYTIRGELGRGGFATVYRALDTKLRREVALKVLKPGWTDDPRAVERFMREATQSAMLKHPNIVTIYDVDQFEGRLFIAMELVPGRSLQQIVAQDGPLPWERTIVILEQAASALDHAHKRGLTHRDVKPANIILDETESGDRVRVVLTDFGLVRGAEQASLTLGSTGGIVGTPEYIAPEVWDGQPAGPASDVYALACSGHYMLTSQVLFGAATPMAVIRRHMQGPLLPRQWPAGIPDSVTEVLQKALARDPAQRTATASEMVAGLRRCQNQEAERHEAVRAQRIAGQAAQVPPAEQATDAEQRQETAVQAAQDAAQTAKAEQEARTAAEQLAHQERERKMHAKPAAPSHGNLGWAFWLLWTLAGGVGVFAGKLASDLIKELVLQLGASDLFAEVILWGTAGAVVGAGQFLVLRRVIKSAWWIPATSADWGLGVMLGALMQPVIQAQAGIGAGIALGVTQWLILRRHVSKAGWWILASTLSWTLAWAIAWNIVGPLLESLSVSDETIASALFVIISGLIGSGLTGVVLIKLWNSYRLNTFE